MVGQSSVLLSQWETVGGIKYATLEGYPQLEESDRESVSWIEKIRIRNEDLETFYYESFPPAEILNNGFVYLPKTRLMPGTTNMFTQTISAVPFVSDKVMDPFQQITPTQPNAVSGEVAVTIKYALGDSAEDDPNNPETLFEHDMSIGGEFLSVPNNDATTTGRDANGEMTGDSPGADEDDKANVESGLAIQKVIPTIEHDFKISFVVDPNWPLILKSLGRVGFNKPGKETDDGGAPDFENQLFFKEWAAFPDSHPDTVMFMGCTARRKLVWVQDEQAAQGRVQFRPWEIDLRFSQRHVEMTASEMGIGWIAPTHKYYFGWNHVYAPKKGRWVYVKNILGQPMHERMDLNELFTSITRPPA